MTPEAAASGIGTLNVLSQIIIFSTAFVLYINWMKSKPPRMKLSITLLNVVMVIIALTVERKTAFMVKFLLLMILNLLIYAYLWLLDRKKDKTVELLEDQLVNALLILSGSLKAGRTLQQAFELVAISLPSPISDEFKQVLAEQHVGVPFEEALKNMLKRVNSKDFKTFITATLFQKETGGNIISLYDQITFAVAERKKLKGRLESITVQGRYSGYLIALLPVVLFLFLNIVNPGYVSVFFDDSIPGNEIAKMLLMTAVLLEIVGILVIRNIVSRRLE